MRILYIAKYSPLMDPGVHNKVKEFLSELQQMGHDSESLVLPPSMRPLQVVKSVLLKLFSINCDYVIIRSLGILDLFSIPVIFYLRLRKVFVILELPVPRRISYNEQMIFRHGISRLRFVVLHYLSGPWVFWPYSRIIQYSDESFYFSIFCKKKTRLIGNGISSNRFPIRNTNYQWPTKVLKLIGVGNLSRHHGFDRVVKAVGIWNSQDNGLKLDFSIVGNGTERKNLENLVESLNLSDYISFLGLKNTKELNELYSSHHLAVSSLGLFRTSLSTSSVLKSREYCLVGIPFIAAGDDPDFSDSCPFRYIVENDDEVGSILLQIKSFLETRDFYYNDDIRHYAVTNLSIKSRILAFGIKEL
jgi:glycosyltransferase involved in cell wall biosynthesis